MPEGPPEQFPLQEETEERRKPPKSMGAPDVPPETAPRTENKEIKRAEFSVTLGKNKLSEIDPEEIIKDVTFIFEEAGQRGAKAEELRRIIEVLMRLPEQLEFKPGVTLVVGENGSGKTTLAKALHYVAQIEWTTANNPSVENKGKAMKRILEPSPNVGQTIDIKNAGLAPHIAKAMSAGSYAAAKGAEATEYWDFAKEAGRLTHLHDTMATEAWFKREKEATLSINRESNRQSVDKIMVERIRREKEATGGPQINFFDEPEVGMSPMRHMKLLEEIESFSSKDSIAIVPTNSPVLFANPDMSRIDLRYPERGIFKPKDYPEE